MNSPQPSDHGYLIHVSRAEQVLWEPGLTHRKKPSLYVEFTVGNNERKSRVVKKSLTPEWKEDIALPDSVRDASSINIRLLHNSALLKDVFIGGVAMLVSALLDLCKKGETRITLLSPAQRPAGLLYVRLTKVGTVANRMIEVHNAQLAVTAVGGTGRARLVDAIETVDGIYKKDTDLFRSIGDLLQKLDAIQEAVDKVAKIHPYLNAAWQVTSALYKAISNQVKTDQAVVSLAAKLSESLDFAQEVETLRSRLKSIESTLEKLFNQITECCMFIREYTGHGFAGRMVKPGNKARIADFVKVLDELKAAIDQGISLNTGIVTSRMVGQMNTLFLKSQLDPDDVDAYGRRACLEGTRVSTLQEITNWLLNDSSQRILWLYGAAGSGKSTISRSIQDHMRALSRLGAYLCFERGRSTPNGVVRTIAYQLGCFDSNIAEKITASIGSSDVKSAPLQDQFRILMEQPLGAATESVVGPIVVVLDALDECGIPSSRRDLLRLFGELEKLPPNVRFFVTSRPEPDLRKVFTSAPWSSSVRAVELDCDSAETRSNVLAFLKHEMQDMAEPYDSIGILHRWEANVEMLASATAGLFISASTAIKMIEVSDDRFGTLEELVSGKVRLDELDSLYSAILKDSGIQWDKEESKRWYQDILGFLILCKAPLSDTLIDGILGLRPQRSSRFILEKLQPLVAYEPKQPLRFRHITISDYFIKSDGKHAPWSINIDSHWYTLTSRCFDIMNSTLRFNICDLDSSFLPNSAITDLEARCKVTIPPHLEYACLYWAQHLQDCKDTFHPQLLEGLQAFLHKKLLFWAEVLSALQRFKGADKILGDASCWLDSTQVPDLHGFIQDAQKLFNMFARPISESLPHIYASMLLLTHEESAVAAHYFKHVTNPGIQITSIGCNRPSYQLKTLDAGDRHYVTSLCCSPRNHTHIVAGYSDGSIRIWNVESGELVFMPDRRHNHLISSLVLTNDGTQIISGSKETIRLWNIEDNTSSVLGKHNSRLGTIIAISPNNAVVASGSQDGTLKLWPLIDSATETFLQPPSYTSNILSISFQPSSNSSKSYWIALSLGDSSIHMWNAVTGELQNLLLLEDTTQILTFSHDGSHLIRGLNSGRICIQDIESNTVLCWLEGHSNRINSLCISLTGEYIVSASWDHTVRVWRVEDGAAYESMVESSSVISLAWSFNGHYLVTGSLSGKTSVYEWSTLKGKLTKNSPGHAVALASNINCIAVSQDKCWIASGDREGLVKVWKKGQSGQWEVFATHRNHINLIQFLPISHDQCRLATGSDDGTVWMWEANMKGDPQIVHVGSKVRDIAFASLENFLWIAAEADDGLIMVWNAESGGELMCLLDYSEESTEEQSGILVDDSSHNKREWASSLRFSSDGAKIAAGYDDGAVRVWEAKSGHLLHTLKNELASLWVTSVAWSDTNKVAVGYYDGAITIWDANSGNLLLGPWQTHSKRYVSSLTFSPDTRLLASSYLSNDGRIQVWDASTGGRLMTVPRGHTKVVNSLMFSPDGDWLVSLSRDTTARIWSTAHLLSPAPILRNDGWLVGDGDSLLIWIPPDLRPSLLWEPAQVDVLGVGFSTRLDLTGNSGDAWRKSFRLKA